ncbi:hypothetical protein KA005_08900, partial [bacterium]|nr:hypothetical protein [bacterium]
DKSSADYPSITIIIGAGFILSYSLGVLVSGLQHICWLAKERFKKVIHRKEAEQTKQIWDMRSEGEFARKYDFIKLKNHTIGSRITKLKAELNMAAAFIFGFSVSFLINLVKLVQHLKPLSVCNWSRIVFGILLLLGMVCTFGLLNHLHRRLVMAVENYADLLGYDTEKPDKWKRESF